MNAANSSRRTLAQHAVAIAVLVAIAAVASVPALRGPVAWTASDSLFYEAQRLELLGRSAAQARAEVFDGTKGRAVALIEDDATPPHVLDEGWVEYSAQFYRRRWTVPAMGAALDRVAGERSLHLVPIAAYLALGPALLVLLRRRFSLPLSFGVAAVCLLLPPVQKWSSFVGMDSWGLVLEVLAFTGLVGTFAHGWRWLALWIPALVALSFTRDAGVALVLGAAWATWLGRAGPELRRRGRWLVATGVAAMAPALVLFEASVRHQLAYVINDFYVPTDTSVAFIMRGYPQQIADTVGRNLTYPLDFPLVVALGLYAGMAVLLAIVIWFLLRAPREPYFDVHRGAVVGYVGFLAVAANPQGYRLELIAVPTLAVALAFCGERLVERRSRAQPGRARGTLRTTA